MRIHMIMTLIAAGLGCASSTAPASPEGRRVGTVAGASPTAPLTVEWVPQGEAGTRLTLVARINRSIPMRVPIAVTVVVPAGLRVISGRTTWTITPDESLAPVEETIIVEVIAGGPQELILAADAEGTGFGVHAKRVYVVGAVAATRNATQAPPPPGPHLEVGGHDYGPSVPAK